MLWFTQWLGYLTGHRRSWTCQIDPTPSLFYHTLHQICRYRDDEVWSKDQSCIPAEDDREMSAYGLGHGWLFFWCKAWVGVGCEVCCLGLSHGCGKKTVEMCHTLSTSIGILCVVTQAILPDCNLIEMQVYSMTCPLHRLEYSWLTQKRSHPVYWACPLHYVSLSSHLHSFEF